MAVRKTPRTHRGGPGGTAVKNSIERTGNYGTSNNSGSQRKAWETKKK